MGWQVQGTDLAEAPAWLSDRLDRIHPMLAELQAAVNTLCAEAIRQADRILQDRYERGTSQHRLAARVDALERVVFPKG